MSDLLTNGNFDRHFDFKMNDNLDLNVSKSILDISKSSYAVYLYDTERLTKSIIPENTENNHLCKSNDTIGFDLLSSDLTSEQECQLRLFLVRRLRKGAIYIRTGNFSNMDFSILDESPSPAVCFYILLPCSEKQNETKQVMFCLIGTSEANLEVFRPELTNYCELILTSIPWGITEGKGLPSNLMVQLNSWYNICIDYVTRVIHVLGNNLALLLQLAQQNGVFEFDPSVDAGLANDVRRFLSVCSIGEFLTPEPALVAQVTQLNDNDNDNEIRIRNIQGNKYCKEWCKKLLALASETFPSRIRKLLEAFKLKTIKDMNMLKRLLKQSETDHYSLYRAYSFLWQSGNSNVLLSQAKLEGSSEVDIINVLEQQLDSLNDNFLYPVSVQ